MTDNVYFWFSLILLTFKLSYHAGKHDLFGMIADWLEAKEMEKYRDDDQKGCLTCRWNDTDPNEVGCPCWNCKGDYSEYAKSMSPEAFTLMMNVLKDMGELED